MSVAGCLVPGELLSSQSEIVQPPWVSPAQRLKGLEQTLQWWRSWSRHCGGGEKRPNRLYNHWFCIKHRVQTRKKNHRKEKWYEGACLKCGTTSLWSASSVDGEQDGEQGKKEVIVQNIWYQAALKRYTWYTDGKGQARRGIELEKQSAQSISMDVCGGFRAMLQGTRTWAEMNWKVRGDSRVFLRCLRSRERCIAFFGESCKIYVEIFTVCLYKKTLCLSFECWDITESMGCDAFQYCSAAQKWKNVECS